MAGLRKAEIQLDRKVLAELAVSDPPAFGAIARAGEVRARSQGLSQHASVFVEQARQCEGRSPLYARLCRRFARRSARGRDRRRRAANGTCRCGCSAGCTTSCSPGDASWDDPVDAARGVPARVRRASRRVQTNEVQRSWVLLPCFLRAAQLLERRRARRRRARAERRAEPRLGRLPLLVRGGRLGPRGRRARAGGRGALAAFRRRCSSVTPRVVAPRRHRPGADRRHDRRGRTAAGVLRLGGSGRAARAADARRSTSSARTRRSSCAATSRASCRTSCATGRRSCSRRRRFRYVSDETRAAVRETLSRAAAPLAFVTAGRPRDGDGWGMRIARYPGGEREFVGARRLPRRVARLRAVITSRAQPEAEADPQAARVAAPAREGGAVRLRGRGSRRRGRARPGIEPVELLVAGEDVDAGARSPSLSTLGHPPRVVGVYRRDDLPRGTGRLALALWHVGDPGNVGTLLRTADAFGAGVALSAGCADPTGPKALRASAGAIFRVPVVPFEEAPRPWIALVAHGGGVPSPGLGTWLVRARGGARGSAGGRRREVRQRRRRSRCGPAASRSTSQRPARSRCTSLARRTNCGGVRATQIMSSPSTYGRTIEPAVAGVDRRSPCLLEQLAPSSTCEPRELASSTRRS